MSQIVIIQSRQFDHNLCVARAAPFSHIVIMDKGDKNGGPVSLQAWRNHLDLSQAELADKANTSANMIGYLESGERALTVKWMRRLAPHLGVRPAWLIDDTPPSPDLVPTADEIASMIQRAMDELPVGTSYADYPRAVSASLHEQLTQYQAAGGFRENGGEVSDPGTVAPPPTPTRRSGGEGSRNP